MEAEVDVLPLFTNQIHLLFEIVCTRLLLGRFPFVTRVEVHSFRCWTITFNIYWHGSIVDFITHDLTAERIDNM